MDVQPWMVKEAREEVLVEQRRNPEGHPDDHRHEAAVTIALEAFPRAPHEEQMRAARAIKRRMGEPGRVPDARGEGAVDPEFDFTGGDFAGGSRQCPLCDGHFSTRDDCPECGGTGVVR